MSFEPGHRVVVINYNVNSPESIITGHYGKVVPNKTDTFIRVEIMGRIDGKSCNDENCYAVHSFPTWLFLESELEHAD